MRYEVNIVSHNSLADIDMRYLSMGQCSKLAHRDVSQKEMSIKLNDTSVSGLQYYSIHALDPETISGLFPSKVSFHDSSTLFMDCSATLILHSLSS